MAKPRFKYKVGDICRWVPEYTKEVIYIVEIIGYKYLDKNHGNTYKYKVLESSNNMDSQFTKINSIITYKASKTIFEQNYVLDPKNQFNQDLAKLISEEA